MEDGKIVELYWQRDERAIEESDKKYGAYCRTVANNILQNDSDAQECVNDTYLCAWNAIPPEKPSVLSTFLGKLTRRISIDRFRRRGAGKRGGGTLAAALDELDECVSSTEETPESALDKKLLAEVMDSFVSSLKDDEMRVFVRRYWYVEQIEKIAHDCGFTQSKVKSMLSRTRAKLRERLCEEGFLQ